MRSARGRQNTYSVLYNRPNTSREFSVVICVSKFCKRKKIHFYRNKKKGVFVDQSTYKKKGVFVCCACMYVSLSLTPFFLFFLVDCVPPITSRLREQPLSLRTLTPITPLEGQPSSLQQRKQLRRVRIAGRS
jgi:hypothetical protein